MVRQQPGWQVGTAWKVSDANVATSASGYFTSRSSVVTQVTSGTQNVGNGCEISVLTLTANAPTLFSKALCKTRLEVFKRLWQIGWPYDKPTVNTSQYLLNDRDADQIIGPKGVSQTL